MPSKGGRESDRSRAAETSKIEAPPPRATRQESLPAEQPSEVPNGPWIFEIVRPTPAAFLCRKKERAVGSRSGQEIGVSHAERGVIGFAPPQESAEMLTALRRAPGTRLLGEVVTAGDDHKKRSPVVTLAIEAGGW